MSVIEVQGLTPLEGEIKIQGSKNAVLPMMAAAILHKGTTVIENVPRIQDVFCMLGILDSIGCKCRLEGNRLKIDASVVTETEIPKKFVKSMRSSIIVSGPLLGRMKRAVTSFPGGCSIGEADGSRYPLPVSECGSNRERVDGRRAGGGRYRDPRCRTGT